MKVEKDCEIMNKSFQAMSPSSKYFWALERVDVMRRRRAREEGPSVDDPSTTDSRYIDLSTNNWLGDMYGICCKIECADNFLFTLACNLVLIQFSTLFKLRELTKLVRLWNNVVSSL